MVTMSTTGAWREGTTLPEAAECESWYQPVLSQALENKVQHCHRHLKMSTNIKQYYHRHLIKGLTQLVRQGLTASGVETQITHNNSRLIKAMIVSAPNGRRGRVHFWPDTHRHIGWLSIDLDVSKILAHGCCIIKNRRKEGKLLWHQVRRVGTWRNSCSLKQDRKCFTFLTMV